jgi:hypothetical protein
VNDPRPPHDAAPENPENTAAAATADRLRDLVALPGPPGQEDAVRAYLADRVGRWGWLPAPTPKATSS